MSADGTTSTSSETRDVVLTRTFDAPIGRVWRAWSDPEDVKRWWGPAGFTVPVAEVDFRVGGTSLVCMRAPAEYGGMDMYNTWTYRAIEEPTVIEFVLNFSDQDGTTVDPAELGVPLGVPADVPHRITFKAVADDRTEMTVHEFGYTSDVARDTSQAGLEQVLDKMAALVSSR